jgi:hypothetical protein
MLIGCEMMLLGAAGHAAQDTDASLPMDTRHTTYACVPDL